MPIPRANILADIAPKHLPPHLRTQLLRNASLLLNRQIRNTSRSIHLPRPHQRIRRTRIDTPRTRPTSVRRRHRPRRPLHLQRSHNHPQQQPRPLLLVDHTSILPNPPHPSPSRIPPLHNRPRVHIATRLTPLAKPLLQLRLNHLQLRQQHLVIVAPSSLTLASTPRIASNPSASRRRSLYRPRCLSVVIQRTHNHRPRPRHRSP